MDKFNNFKLLVLPILSCLFFQCSTLDKDRTLVDFTVDTKVIYETNGIHFSLLNPQAVTQASWFFEGGEPEYFNDKQPPTIYYGKAGEYTVTLNIVVNGQKQVIIKENFIMVQEKPNDKFNFYTLLADKATMKSGESIDVWVYAIGEDLSYVWSSSTGSIKGEGPKVKFTASPCFQGIAEISALVSNNYGSMQRTIQVNVVKE